MSEKFVIRLLIGNDTYPFTVRREKEEVYRNAAKLINQTLSKYEQAYPKQGHEKYMVMTLLDLAVTVLQLRDSKDTEPYNSSIEQLVKELEEVLSR